MDDVYRKVEKMVRPILLKNAKGFAKQLDMTHEDAMQEARYALSKALQEYDYNASRGGIFNFAKTAVERHFLKLWARHRAWRRRPNLRFTAADGKRVWMPVPFVEQAVDVDVDFLDTFESPLSLPDASVTDADAKCVASAFQKALEAKLSERDRAVLRCKASPPRGLRVLMLDELAAEPTLPLICKYLGLSRNEVDWAVRRIRDAALELIRGEFSDLTDLSVVQAYAERRACLK